MSRVCVCLLMLLSFTATAEPLRDGDLVFHTSRSAQSLAIQRATHSPYSHVGLVFHQDGEPYVLEAIANVRYTPLAQWVARGAGGRYEARRLGSGLTTAQADKLRAAARKYVARPYDPFFEWSGERIYCSELVFKVYRDALNVELGRLQKLRDFDLSDPVVRAKMRERYGARIPLDEPVISPGAQFASPLLKAVPR